MKNIFALLLMGVLFMVFMSAENFQANAQTVNTGTLGSTSTFSDDFSNYSSILNKCIPDETWFNPWESYYNGYGCVKIESDSSNNPHLYTSPKASTSITETHAALVLGPSFSDKFTFEVDLYTKAQLRTGSIPKLWEVGWVMWDFTDKLHGYYFLPKPNGWELGKVDPAYQGAQRYLVTGSDIKFPINTWYHIKIIQDGNKITVYVNDKFITTFTDLERPYTQGQIGLYNEDATVYFDNIKVSSNQTVTPSQNTVSIRNSTTINTPTLSNLTVKAVDKNGNVLHMNTLLKTLSGKILVNGYSPIVFKVNTNSDYIVKMNSYRSHVFQYWQDQPSNNDKSRHINIKSDTTIVAVFS